MNAALTSCDYCGLPLPGKLTVDALRSANQGREESRYCCFGCRFAADVTRERGETGAAQLTLVRLGLAIFFTMNVVSFTMALWAQPLYGESPPTPWGGTLDDLFRYLSLLLSLPVLFLLGQPLVENAWKELRDRRFSTDLLLASGVASAFAYSAVSVFRGAGDVYFEVGCIILVMVTLGRWLEATGRLKAGAALDELQKLLPDKVRLVRNGVERMIPTGEVVPGDLVRVLPGERIPIDGRLRFNAASVDEQLVTGESWPVSKLPGDSVIGGTLNLDGDIMLEATHGSADGTLARLIDAVILARQSQGRYQRLANRISAAFFPTIAAVALATFGYHWCQSDLSQGLLAGLAVVLIACPCALGVATPLAVWSALGRAARKQVLFRNGEALERLADVKVFCFDKTGTLTTGVARVEQFAVESGTNPVEVFRNARTLAGATSHAYSRAILDFSPIVTAGETISSLVSKPGRGVVGRLRGGSTIALGNLRLMAETGLQLSGRLRAAAHQAQQEGWPITLIGWGGRVRGLFVFEEQLREDVHAVLGWCRKRGLKVVVLTGDHRGRAARLGEELAVSVRAELLPDDKTAAVRELQSRFGPVVMVGDGVNDAPAISASHVGISLGSGTDVSRDSAGICLMSNRLSLLWWAVEFSQTTVRTIRRDLICSFLYNGVGVVLAAAGWLNPAAAALLMIGSSCLVINSALRSSRDADQRGASWPELLPSRGVEVSCDVLPAEEQDHRSLLLAEKIAR